ncbi:MAG TPA: glycosyltransferase family 9 protein [Acidobacteriota bacterium]|nr:glycosyltransferase family 9 protein [Acidobacteriota bacterium]
MFSFDLLYSLSFQYQKIGLCTSSQHAKLLNVFPIPNSEIIEYEGGEWPYLNRESILRIDHFQGDEALLLTNSIGSALLFKYAGVNRLMGYDTEHRGFLLSKSLKPFSRRVHQTEYYLRLLELFDAPVHQYPKPAFSARAPLVVIHPGASKKERAWPLERFIKVGEHFKKEGWEVMIVSAENVPESGLHTCINPELSEFVDLLKRCSLFIGNDSGPLHLAQQCGAAVVGIFGPGDPRITGPRDISPAQVISHNFPCSPCRQKFFHECDPSPNQKPYCIETISSLEVIRAGEELVKTSTVLSHS